MTGIQARTDVADGAARSTGARARTHDARVTGAWYLGLGLTGLIGSLGLRARVFDAGDAAATLEHLVTNESTARAAVAFTIGMALTQTFAAVYFYRLFRTVDSIAAASIAAFGLVNAALLLVAAAGDATAIDLAAGGATRSDDLAGRAQLLYVFGDRMSGVASLFFGLWLLPMGWLVLRSRWMPAPLGWILVLGGGCYVLACFLRVLLPGAAGLADTLVLPPTVGEFWMVGYLLVRGVRPTPS